MKMIEIIKLMILPINNGYSLLFLLISVLYPKLLSLLALPLRLALRYDGRNERL